MIGEFGDLPFDYSPVVLWQAQEPNLKMIFSKTVGISKQLF